MRVLGNEHIALFLSHHPSCPFWVVLSSCFSWTFLPLICYFQNVSGFEALCREQMKSLVDVRCWHEQSLWPVGEWQCLPWRLGSWKWQYLLLIRESSQNVYCSFLPLKLMAWGLFPYRDCSFQEMLLPIVRFLVQLYIVTPPPCSTVYNNLLGSCCFALSLVYWSQLPCMSCLFTLFLFLALTGLELIVA